MKTVLSFRARPKVESRNPLAVINRGVSQASPKRPLPRLAGGNVWAVEGREAKVGEPHERSFFDYGFCK